MSNILHSIEIHKINGDKDLMWALKQVYDYPDIITINFESNPKYPIYTATNGWVDEHARRYRDNPDYYNKQEFYYKAKLLPQDNSSKIKFWVLNLETANNIIFNIQSNIGIAPITLPNLISMYKMTYGNPQLTKKEVSWFVVKELYKINTYSNVCNFNIHIKGNNSAIVEVNKI